MADVVAGIAQPNKILRVLLATDELPWLMWWLVLTITATMADVMAGFAQPNKILSEFY